MKKTRFVFLISFIFLSACLFYCPPSAAQNASTPFSQGADIKEVPLLIRNAISAGAHFERRELFQTVASPLQDHPKLSQVLNHGTVLNLNETIVANTLREKVQFLTLPLPDGKGGTVELELTRVDIFAPGFSVKTAAPTTEDLVESLGVHYRGIVKGDERSLAAISVFKNEVMGFFSTETEGSSVLGRFSGNNPSNEHVLYAVKDLKVTPEFSCDTQDPGVTLPASDLQEPEGQAGNCIRVYIEADHDLFLNKGSVANTASYLTGLFNQSATLYGNDGIPVSLSEMLIWDVESPYAGLNTPLELRNKFQEIRNTFNGDLGHLVAIRGNGGIAAGFDGFCNANLDEHQCFSGIDPFYSNVPVYSWSVNVFTHEMGHLMGSRHTHACVWNGTSTAIDACGPTAGYPYEGSCSGAPLPPPNGGTIMSYCHLVANVGINFSLGFGSQPRNVILNHFNAAPCLTACGGGCTNTPITVGQTLNGTLTATDCRYPTGTEWYSDPYTFSGTAGQQIAITMTSSAFDTWLALQDPNGAELTVDNDGGGGTNSRIPANSGFYTLPSTGTYKIQASSNFVNATGSYAVSLAQSGPSTWTDTDIAVGPDNQFRSLWKKTDGTVALWRVAANGAFQSTSYGPYSGWTAKAIAAGSNDVMTVLWTHTNGSVSLFGVAANGGVQSTIYGPYAGWTAADIGVGGDNQRRVLWTNTNGSISVWVVASNGNFQASVYGPYAGWTARRLAVGSDNQPRVLWTHSNGSVALWAIAANGSFQSYTYGPYSGWTGADIGVGSDNKTRVLWNNANGSITSWIVQPNGTFQATSYGPYTGWTGRSIAVGSDNQTRVLWTHTSGQASQWVVAPNGSLQSFVYGPY